MTRLMDEALAGEHGSSSLVVQDFNVDVARWGSECQKEPHLYSASGP